MKQQQVKVNHTENGQEMIFVNIGTTVRQVIRVTTNS